MQLVRGCGVGGGGRRLSEGGKRRNFFKKSKSFQPFCVGEAGVRALRCTGVLESLRISLRLSQGRRSAGGLRFGSLEVNTTEDAWIRSVPNITQTSETKSMTGGPFVFP